MRAQDRAITGLTTIGHALVHTYELSIPILMTVWLRELGASTAELGVAVSVGYALFGIGALPGGILTDRYGSKRLIGACLLGMGGAFVLLSLAQGLVLIAGALAVWGAAASVYHPAGLTLISKGTSERGRVFAYHGMAGNLGIALGPLAATVLLLFLDWRIVCLVLAVPGLLMLPVIRRLQVREEPPGGAPSEGAEPTPRGEGGLSEAFSWRQFWTDTKTLFASGFAVVFLIVLLAGMFYRGVLTFLPDLLERIATLEPITLSGALTLEPGRYVYVGLLLVGVLGQYVGGRLTDRLPIEHGLAVALTALSLVAFFFLPIAGLGLASLLVISAALGFLLFGLQPLYQAAVADYTPPGARGLSYGYNYLGVFGVGALGAALAGTLLDAFGPQTMFSVLGLLTVAAALAAVVLARRRVREAAAA